MVPQGIVEQLRSQGLEQSALQVPRPQECLKYMLRLHLRVNALDFKKHLQQVQVRPHVLVALLDFLIDNNHESFRGKAAPEALKQQIRKEVAKEYPEDNAVPRCLLEAMSTPDEDEQPPQKRSRQAHDKNATPGNAPTTLENCLDDLRPTTVCLDKDAKACVDTGRRHQAALERVGDLKIEVQEKDKEVLQFHSKYISQVLPFVA